MTNDKIKKFYELQIKKILESLGNTFELLIEGGESDIEPLIEILKKKRVDFQILEDYNFINNRKDYLVKILKLILSRKNYEEIEEKTLLFTHQGYLKFDFLFRNSSTNLILTHDGEIIRR